MSLTYRELLTDFAEHSGLDAASLLLQQEVCIGGLSIFLQQSGEADAPDLLLCSVLGTPSTPRLAQVVMTLMQANHLWAGTGGGTLGLSPAGDTVTWSLRLQVRDLVGATLATLLAGFAELGQAWAKYIGADADQSAQLSSQMIQLAVRA